MKILHTSDWHLGRTLHGTDLLGCQQAFVDHLVNLVHERQIDAVLVSGDVYDRAVPAVEAVRILSDALARLSEHTAVIVTPGNHDSAVRLGFGAGLMRDNIRLLTRVEGVAEPVVLHDRHGALLVYGFPYLDPDSARPLLKDAQGELPGRSHEAVLTAAMTKVRADLERRSREAWSSRREAEGTREATERIDGPYSTSGPNLRAIVMAHAFIVGGTASDSERDISIGGVDSCPSAVFDGVDYVALGHLHGQQKIRVPDSSTSLRYSGSPLAYSFSEMHHRKSSVIIEFDAGGVASEELVDTPIPRRLAEIKGTMEHLLSPATDGHCDDWLRICVTDSSYPQDMASRLRQRFAHVLVIEHAPEGASERHLGPAVTEAMKPTVVAADFVEYVSNQKPTDQELDVLYAAYESAIAEQRGA